MSGTGLANFREQFPQYAHIDDEELAGLVKQRYYPDMPETEYRDAMGLAPLPEPPPEPSLWDRATSIFRSEDDTPEAILSDRPDLAQEFAIPEPSEPEPSPLLRDQFFAGWDEYRANRATARSLRAVEAYQDAEDVARGRKDVRPTGGPLGVSGAQITRQTREARAEMGDPDAERAIQAEIATSRGRLTDVLQRAIDQRADLMQRARTVPYSQATQEMLEAEGFGESVGEWVDDPIGIIAEVGLRSLPNMADAIPLAVGGAMVGGPLGFVGGMGAGAAMTEYRASFADALQEQGVDLTSAESLLNAADNPELMARAHDFAIKRSTIIGGASAISGGIATRPMTPFINNAIGRELANVAAQTVVQAGIEGGGEALAQLATTGEVRGGEVLAEAIGGALTAPIDVGTAAVSGVRAQMAINEAARVESEVNEMLGTDREPTVAEEDATQQDLDDMSGTLEVPQQVDGQPSVADEDAAQANLDQLAETVEVSRETPPPVNDAADTTPVEAGIQEQASETGYADLRLERVEMRRELQDTVDAVDPTRKGARAAQKAVNRAITAKPLTPVQARVVRSMLDAIDDTGPPDVLDMAVPSDRMTGDRRGGQRGRGPDRRREDRIERVRSMDLDQLVDEIYTDPLTQIANRRAWDEDAERHAWVAEIDADSLKWINDNLSEEAGDAMLIAVAEALDQTDVDAYRIGGDEYVIGGETREAVESAAELAKGILANQAISDTRGRVQGLNITYGVGQSKEIAAATLKQQKVRREQAGKRSPRGIAPPGAELTVAHMKPVDMMPGTNYVPMIGNTGKLPIDANNNLVLGNGRTVQIPKTPVRREHILAVMQRAFGNKIYEGRIKGKTRLGFYRPGHGEIRIKNANDIEVAAHEVAHWLDDRYPWISKLYKQYGDEVKSVSYDQKKDYEGFAEFMRLFMTQEYEVIHRTPAFYDAFRQELTKYPKLEKTVYDLQELMHAWTQQGARARLASKHGSAPADFFERIRTLFRVPFLQSALDGLRRIRQVEMDVDGTDVAYRKLRLALGGANGVLEAAMFYGTPGWRADKQGLEFTGDSLRDIFGNYWGDEDLALYMMARRGKELRSQDRENLMRPDEIAAGLKLATEENGFEAMFDAFQEFNSRMLDFAEGSGILGAETRAMIEEMNKNYVPFHRVIESQVEGRSVRRGGNPFQRLRGGTQNVNNIWDNVVNNNGMIIRMALINDGKRTLLRSLSAIGSDPSKAGPLGANQRNQAAGKYAAPIAPKSAPVNIASEQVIRKSVEAMGISWQQYVLAKEGMFSDNPTDAALEQMVVQSMERMENGLQEFVQFWQHGLAPSGTVDFYMNNGKKVWFEIGDAALWDSLQFLGPKGTNLALGVLGAFSATLRRGVVAVPVFQIKNFIRDTTNAWLLSDHVKVPAARAMGVVFSKMMSDPMYQEMMLNGGGFANRAQGLQAQRKIIVNPTRLAAIYDRFMGRFENANRLAEYKAARAAGVTPDRAALLSREISTDFAMRGSSETARFLAISVPFLNARVQGNYRIARQFTRAEAALSYAMRGTALSMATLALYALVKDDERYKELPEDIKDLNWVFFTGPGEDDYFLVPKPFESGMLWGTIPERLFELTETRDGKEFADAMGWMFLQTFNMDMTPQVFQPEIDLQRNKNFTGAPIIPFYLENVEPSQQFTWYTSETAREAGERFSISPIKLEHRIRGYLGTLGTYALGASDAMLRAMSDPDELAFGEDPTRGETWKENIVVRGLIDPLVGEGPPRRTKYVTDLYDMIREAQRVANTTDLMLRRQNEEVEAYLTEPANQARYAANAALEQARRRLNEVRKQQDLVRMSQDLDGDEKRVRLWELQRQRNAIAREAVIGIEAAQTQIEEQARE